MSENTSTSSGVSNNDLYSIIDKGVETNFVDFEEKDPQKDKNASTNFGSNTSVKPVEIGTIDGEQIEKVGYVGIPIQNVMDKNQYDKKKKEIFAKADKSRKDREKAEEAEEMALDKNHNGIDDRYEQ